MGLELRIEDVGVAAVEEIVVGAIRVETRGGVGVAAVAEGGDTCCDDFAVILDGDAGQYVTAGTGAAEVDALDARAVEGVVDDAVGVHAGNDKISAGVSAGAGGAND